MAREATKTFNDKSGNRRGFVTKQISRDEPQKTRYGVGIDNVGSPYRGALDREINTPLGKIDYGYDGDTVYGGVTPNAFAGSYKDPQETHYWAGYNDYDVRAGKYNNDTIYGSNPMYYASLNLPENVNIPNAYKSAITPIGSFEFGTNDGNPGVWADYQPQNNTNYYLQALANLLRR